METKVSPSKPHLTPTKRGRIYELVEMKVPYATIAKKFGCSISTVGETYKRFKKHGSHYDRPKSGRPRALSERDRRMVLRYVQFNQWKSWRELSDLLRRRDMIASPSMIRNIAHAHGLKRYKARERPALSGVARATRNLWAKSNKHSDWTRVIFTDECSLDSSDLKRKPYITRAAGTATLPRHTSRSFRGSRRTVMIWAAIALGKKSSLVRLSGTGQPKVDSARYIEKVMNTALRSFVLECELEALVPYSVVEDNASVHNSKLTNAARDAIGINRKPHPPLSPDLNPIEKAWRLLKSRLRARNLTNATPDQLWAAAQAEWDLITPNDLDKYIEDMPNRVHIVRKRKGLFSE